MIDSFSSFYYGYKINAQPYNGYINIREGAGPELQISIPVGSYTLSTLAIAVRNALLGQATLDYTVLLDRTNRSFTISAPSSFELLLATGANAGNNAFSLLGFGGAADLIGLTTYSSNILAGEEYRPQFRLQSFTPKEDFQSRNQSTKNVASDGTTIEVINFGIAKFVQFEIKYITSKDNVADGQFIEKNAMGLEEARSFLQYITELNEFEINYDRDQVGNFDRVIVESMPDFPDGTGYRLRELYSENLRDIYQTGLIKLRVVD